jgi:hypothetical protein
VGAASTGEALAGVVAGILGIFGAFPLVAAPNPDVTATAEALVVVSWGGSTDSLDRFERLHDVVSTPMAAESTKSDFEKR